MNEVKNIVIFPGQGAQKVGMGMEFYENYEWARDIWKESCDILKFNLKDTVINGPAEELKRTVITQPAVFVTEIIAYEALRRLGFRPVATAGHSLGEYTAVVASGIIDWRQGLELVRFRGEIFEKTALKNPGGMIAVIGLGEQELMEILKQYNEVCEIVNYNSPGQLVISAETAIIEDVVSKVKAGGAKMAVPLDVSGGFHSSLMDEAVGFMNEKINPMEFKLSECILYSNYTGRKASTAEEVKNNLIKQVNSPVRWIETIGNVLSDNGKDVEFIEVGPGRVLQGLLKRIDRKITVKSVSTPDDIEKIQITNNQTISKC